MPVLSLKTRLAVVAAALAVVPAADAMAYDTEPHASMTRDAMASEGFQRDAMDLAVVNNWWIDYYENASTNPFSGRAGWKTLLAGDFSKLEFWPSRVVEAADQTHFDSSGDGFPGAAAIDAEWKRLSKATANLAREAVARNDPQMLVTVLGTSLHQVQDFYTHSNFLEGAGVGTGPGWRGRGYGTSPLWSDVPDEIKLKEQIFSGTDPHTGRGHGNWKTDDNAGLTKGTNKDWPGRPLFDEAFVASYLQTRQWLRSVRTWVGNDTFWARAQAFRAPSRRELDNDVTASLAISRDSGHWQGHGEPFLGDAPGPGGSIEDLAKSTHWYHRVVGYTRYRRMFEDTIVRLASKRAADPSPAIAPLAGVADLRRGVSFAKLTVSRIDEKGAGDNWPDRGDFYVKANIAGQPYISGTIFGRDTFSFGRPHGPHTFIKAVPNPAASIDEPVTSLQVRVKTGDVRFAGTDDDVYLRVSDGRRFLLDKSLYNDFERGDNDTYSLPLDELDLNVRDIRFLQIEKSRDGVAGGWRLGGAQVTVNGRSVARNDAINRWLEDSKRTFRLAYAPAAPRVNAVPVRLALWEDDAFIYGDDDHADIHPDVARRDATVAWSPARGALSERAAGGDRFGGRLGDGDRANVDWQLRLVNVVHPAPPPVAPKADPPVGGPVKVDPGPQPKPEPKPEPTPDPQPTGPGKPDLVARYISDQEFTLTNRGDADAGPFSVNFSGGEPLLIEGGVKAGQTITRQVPNCGNVTITVDSFEEIAESNEDNNQTFRQIVCPT